MKTVTIEQQSAMLEKRKAETGLSGSSFVPVNSGENRTESKRALLTDLDKTKPGNNRSRGFKANY